MCSGNKLNLEQLELAIRASHVGVWDWKIQKNELFFNDVLAEIIGYDIQELQPIQFKTWLSHIHPEDQKETNHALKKHLNGEVELYVVEFRMRHKQGHYVWILATGKSIEWYKDGQPSRMVGTHIDITQRKQDESAFKTASELLDASQKIAKVGGWQLDVLSSEIYWTAETYRIHETSPEVHTPSVDTGLNFYLPRSKKILTEALNLTINQGKSFDLELEVCTQKGRNIYVRAYGVATKHNGQVVKVTGTFQDISEQKSLQRKLEISIHETKQANEQLKQSANFDALTGLPNRNLLSDRMNQSLMRSKRNDKCSAILFLDLDGFKEINDLFGHKIGDEFLCHISDLLKNTVREYDTVARFGGDEFIIILDGLERPDSCIDFLKRTLNLLSETVFINNKAVKVSASVGVTTFPQDDSNADQLIRHADIAMYLAKDAGKNQFHFFDATKEIAKKTRQTEVKNISSGLEEDEFLLYYQPKVNLKTNSVIGVEALIRWLHPKHGLLPPANFLPLVEQSPLAIDVGEWVIKKALTELSLWFEKGIDIPISVNISPLHLQHSDFFSRIEMIFESFPNFKPGSIEFEIIETTALDDIEKAASVINKCRGLGIKFSIDDFGTGYSSLTYLKRLPTEYLKIDCSFIQDMLHDGENKAIVQGIIQLGKAFDRAVIAEGVETIEHGKELLRLGCYLVQGYGIAKPMPKEVFFNWLTHWHEKNEWQYLTTL